LDFYEALKNRYGMGSSIFPAAHPVLIFNSLDESSGGKSLRHIGAKGT
jgi:hypothetical protein